MFEIAEKSNEQTPTHLSRLNEPFLTKDNSPAKVLYFEKSNHKDRVETASKLVSHLGTHFGVHSTQSQERVRNIVFANSDVACTLTEIFQNSIGEFLSSLTAAEIQEMSIFHAQRMAEQVNSESKMYIIDHSEGGNHTFSKIQPISTFVSS